MPLSKTAGDTLEDSAKEAFEIQMEDWTTRLKDQAAADGMGEDEDEASVEVLKEMAEWAVRFAMWVY